MAQSLAATLLPIMGVGLRRLPRHRHRDAGSSASRPRWIGLGTFVVGLVAGSQFAASLVSRPWAGNFSDSSGAKRGVVVGLLAAAASGLLYLLRSASAGLP